MKKINLIFILLFLQSCSYINDSKYLNKHDVKRMSEEKNLNKIIEKSKNITLMSLNEYKIYINDYIIKSKYPDITR